MFVNGVVGICHLEVDLGKNNELKHFANVIWEWKLK